MQLEDDFSLSNYYEMLMKKNYSILYLKRSALSSSSKKKIIPLCM